MERSAQLINARNLKVWVSSSNGFSFCKYLVDSEEVAVLALAVKDESTLYAGMQGGIVRVFDLATFTVIRNLSAGLGDILSLHISDRTCAATSSSGHLLARCRFYRELLWLMRRSDLEQRIPAGRQYSRTHRHCVELHELYRWSIPLHRWQRWSLESLAIQENVT